MRAMWVDLDYASPRIAARMPSSPLQIPVLEYPEKERRGEGCRHSVNRPEPKGLAGRT